MEELVKVELGDDAMPDGTPLKNVSEHSPADVLCGRGGGTNHHDGNNRWRALVAANKRLYIRLPKKQKVLVAKSIVHAVRAQTPGGRFLQKDLKAGVWNDIGDQKAIEKTGQSLREGAPDIRTEMEQEQQKGTVAAEPAASVLELGSYPKPGQILPNGLITLDYTGVLAAQQKGVRGPLEDGTIDINHSVLPPSNSVKGLMCNSMPSAQQLHPSQPIDPMMQAFQKFLGAKTGQGMILPPPPYQALQQPTPATANPAKSPQDAKVEGEMPKLPDLPSEQTPKENSLKLPLPQMTGGHEDQTESSHTNNENASPPSSSIPAQGSHLLSRPTTGHRDASMDAAPALGPSGMSREMAMEILLKEKAQKACMDAAEANLKTLQSLQHGRLGPAGLPQGSSSLLTEYLARNNIPPAPASLPTLGNVKSMSDEAIQEMLDMLKSQSSTAASDWFKQAGLMRNPRLRGIIGTVLSDPRGANIDKLASQYTDILSRSGGQLGSQLHPPLPNGSSLASTFAAAQTASIGRTESLGFQQAIHDAIRFLGPNTPSPPNLAAAESLGPTPLHRGVSVALAQIKVAGLHGAAADTPRGAGTHCVPPADAGTPAPMFKTLTQAALNEHVEMTSALQRGLSGGSLDDLCCAAPLFPSPKQRPAPPGNGVPPPNASNLLNARGGIDSGGHTSSSRVRPSQRVNESTLSRKMKMFQGLMDSNHQLRKRRRPLCSNPSLAPQSGWASIEWENLQKQQVAMNVGCAASGGLKLGKNDQSLMDDSDGEEDHANNINAPLVVATLHQAKHGGQHSFEEEEHQRPAKRYAATINSNIKEVPTKPGERRTSGFLDSSMFPNAPGRDLSKGGFSRSSGVSFSLHAPPIAETMLDRGHSFAMSEISLDRGHSVSTLAGALGRVGGDDNGQFDDASEGGGQEEEEQEHNSEIQRGLTIGTMHTFSSALGR